jgi:anti-sigma B factor antagonist
MSVSFLSDRKEETMLATVEVLESVAFVRMFGEFDFSSQDMLEGAFNEAVNSPSGEVQVDLEKTTFFDSSVLRMLLKLREMTVKSGKGLSLINCHERLREIFEVGGFDRIFAIYYAESGT